MPERLVLDPTEVVRLSRKYAVLADEAMELLWQLKVGLDSQGAPWGDDKPGRTFAETYLPALHQLLDGLHTVVRTVDMHGENLAGLAETIAVQDDTIAASVREVEDPISELPSSGSVPSSVTATTIPTSSGSVSSTSPAAEHSANSVAAESAYPVSPTAFGHAPQAAKEQVPRFPSDRQPQPIRQPQPPTQQPQSPTPQLQSQGPAPQSQQQSPQRRPRVTADRDRPSARTITAAGASAGTGASASPTMPRPSGPASLQRRAGVPAADEAPPPRGGSGNTKPASARPATSSRPKPDNDRPKIVRSVVERYGIEVSGFDNPDIDDDVVVEFAAALDDVLPRYPAIDLRGVAICELRRGEVSTATWNWTSTPDGPRHYTTRIVLAAAAARDRGGVTRRVRLAVESNQLVPGSEERPVYSTIVRELGRALDVAGGFRARRRVQSVLLAHYLPLAGKRDGLRAVLDSYREWRGGLSGYSFYGQRLHPGRCLAEAFTDVHLHGASASAPARVLHHLLVQTAEAANPHLIFDSADQSVRSEHLRRPLSGHQAESSESAR
ncbi:hypothetical protein AB0C34_28200 [Nocardia sp. NPDC049220]|uniref:hypothetical protein n=1 Tax=Nocardia sp. NPDC049220 TaxID=3155273 RepID=UPI0033C9F0B4